MLQGLHFTLFEKTNTPCNIGESYRCGIGNPYPAASINHYQRVVNVRTFCVVVKKEERIIIIIKLCGVLNYGMYWVRSRQRKVKLSLAAYPMLLYRQLNQSSVVFFKSI